MPFLVLTREGFRDLQQKNVLAGATAYLNPGVATPEEILAIATSDATLHVLPQAIDVRDETAVTTAIRSLTSKTPEPVWVESTYWQHAGKQLASLPAWKTHRLPSSVVERKRLHENLLQGASYAWTQWRRRRASGQRLLLIPYLGYGNSHTIVLHGRVLEDEGLGPQAPDATTWENLISFYKRLESDQVPGVRVLARFGGVEQEAVSDQGGYFSFELHLPDALDTAGWHEIDLQLLAPLPARDASVRASATVLVPPPSARFGVISDIDDTVLWTNATNKLNMLLTVARSNTHTRKPFKGVAAFYRALHDGAGGTEENPFFYVSSSPWQLFEPLLEFLRLQHIPVGPLMLKKLELRRIFGPARHHDHKLAQIENIVRMYPTLSFILIGDSGQQDPEIYAEVVRRYPQRIRVIYIRNVNPDPSRIEAMDRLIEEVRATGAQLILAPDSEYAAAHAAAEGLIKPIGVASVRVEKKIEETLANAEGNQSILSPASRNNSEGPPA